VHLTRHRGVLDETFAVRVVIAPFGSVAGFWGANHGAQRLEGVDSPIRDAATNIVAREGNRGSDAGLSCTGREDKPIPPNTDVNHGIELRVVS
jgi:hypothetical protein